MKSFSWLVLAALVAPCHGTEVPDPSRNSIMCGDISGVWDLAGSPYYVVCDVTVPEEQVLEIRPGVQVLFTGHYKFNVLGNLQAIGSESQPITFTRAFPTEASKWWGIRFADSASDSSRLSHCIVEYGHASGPDPDCNGGGLSAWRCNLTIENSIFRNNYAENGGAIVFNEVCYPLVRNCVFNDNQANPSSGSAGAICHFPGEENGGLVTVDRCVIYDNAASSGGALWPGRSDFLIKDSVIFGNTASQEAGAMHMWHDAPYSVDVVNTVFYGNTAPDGDNFHYGEASGTINASYCNISDGLPGIGNISADPMFVDASNGDFHLLQNSPCINTGDPTFPFDPDGTRSDMGAFYFCHDNALQITQPDVFVVEPGHPESFILTLQSSCQEVQIDSARTGTSAFVLDQFPLSIPAEFSEGQFHLTFDPSSQGLCTDTLHIWTNAIPQHILVPLVGESGPIPGPVTDLSIHVLYDQSVQLTWSPVTQTIYGNPVVPDYYLIYYSEDNPADDHYFYLWSVTDPGFLHLRVARFAPQMYYRIVAYKGINPDQLGVEPGMTLPEVQQRLAGEIR